MAVPTRVADSVWVEKNKGEDALQRAIQLRKDEKLRDEVSAKGPVTVAVNVTQPRGDERLANPHGLGGDQQPCLIVFGDATWINDTEMNERFGNDHFALFGACVSWLRERPDITPDKGTDRPVYELNVKAIDPLRLFCQPLGLMVLGVFGLGGAVWVARAGEPSFPPLPCTRERGVASLPSPLYSGERGRG